MNFLKKFFNFVIFIQFGMLILFILLNIESLDEISIYYIFDSDTTEYTLNFYTLLVLLLALMLFGVLTSLNIFGGGLNEEGSKLLMKYLALILLMAILFTASLYFLLPLGFLGIIINLMFIFSYAMKILNDMIERGSQSE